LLLDRRRINKWAKWVALFLAIVFAGGFLFLGVGYGGAGFNVSDAFSCANQKTVDNPQTPKDKIAVYQAALDKNPSDTAALLGMATVYQQNDQLTVAAAYLEKVIAVAPSQKEVYIRLANIYLNANVAQYQAAVTVLNKATSVDPSNPDVYLKLGTAQNGLGNTGAAVLAWQKYLQLAPNGEMAAVVKEQIDKLSQKATTTTTAGSTTTTAGSTTTTAGSTTTSTTK
jgi:cytochrome c-type biogenesis protein CcmH/NrfG